MLSQLILCDSKNEQEINILAEFVKFLEHVLKSANKHFKPDSAEPTIFVDSHINGT